MQAIVSLWVPCSAVTASARKPFVFVEDRAQNESNNGVQTVDGQCTPNNLDKQLAMCQFPYRSSSSCTARN
eukprot:6285937-Amphidinium_carterae.1